MGDTETRRGAFLLANKFDPIGDIDARLRAANTFTAYILGASDSEVDRGWRRVALEEAGIPGQTPEEIVAAAGQLRLYLRKGVIPEAESALQD